MIKKKLLLYRLLIGMSVGTISFGITNALLEENTSKTLVKVSDDVRNNLYNNSDFNYDIEKLNEGDIDINITLKALEKIKSIELTMLKNEDLQTIELMPNLEKITIKNSELLTDEDIEFINDSNIEEVELIFNAKDINPIRENKFEHKQITKKIILNLEYLKESQGLIMLEFLNNWGKNVEYSAKIDELMELDAKLNKIVSDLNLKQLTDEDKIIVISNYICDKIRYDPEVSKKKNDVHDKIEKYNIENISSILNLSESEVDGICDNYSALFDILGYKAGLKTRQIVGKSEESNHAWNMIYLNDSKKFIDLTSFDHLRRNDAKIFNNYLLKNYIDNIDTDYANRSSFQDMILTDLYIDNEAYLEYYDLINDIESLDQQVVKGKIIYYNEDIRESKTLNDSQIQFLPLISFITSGFLSISYEKKHRRKRIMARVRKK